MQLNVYAGNQYSLQFPVMCDAYVKVDYSDNVASEPTGLWGHKGSFTIETLFTPYDVNGFGSDNGYIWGIQNYIGNQLSSKSIPSTYTGHGSNTQDNIWLNVPNRFKHKPVLFYNTNCQVTLYNNTRHNHNQPAEYGLEFTLKVGGITDTIRTEPFIQSRHGHANFNHEPKNYIYEGGKAIAHKWFRVRWNPTYNVMVDNGDGTITFPIWNYFENDGKTPIVTDKIANILNVGDTFYLETGQVFGTIVSYTTNKGSPDVENVTVALAEGITIVGNLTTSAKVDDYELAYGSLCLSTAKEALYLLSTYHVAVAFDNSTRRMSIFINGQEAASKTHNCITTDDNFQMTGEDCYIGQNPNSTTLGKRLSQFIGEIHEMSIEDRYKSEYTSLSTLLPSFKHTLLYLDFEEVDA